MQVNLQAQVTMPAELLQLVSGQKTQREMEVSQEQEGCKLG